MAYSSHHNVYFQNVSDTQLYVGLFNAEYFNTNQLSEGIKHNKYITWDFTLRSRANFIVIDDKINV